MKILLPLALVFAPSAAHAAESGAAYTSAGVAQYWLHADDDGPGGWLAVGYDLGPVTAEVGLTIAPSYGTGFGSLDVGLSTSPWRRGRLRPFAYAGLGSMGEEDFSGLWIGAGAGLDLRLGRSNSLRLSAGVARHGEPGGEGFRGPHRLGLAWKHAFRRAR